MVRLLDTPLARIKIDETNCFGRLEWPAIRAAAHRELPRHAAVAGWKHKDPSYVEQDAAAPQLKNRGAEQGDVDGPLECGVTMMGVASKARGAIHQGQHQGTLPWAPTVNASEADASYLERAHRSQVWEALHPKDRRSEMQGNAIIPDPMHEVQQGGALLDAWYLDDGDILTFPNMVAPYLRAFDEVNAHVGALRNLTKTEVILYTSPDDLHKHHTEWDWDFVRSQATVRFADDLEGITTLGVVNGQSAAIEAQVAQKAQIVATMYQRAELCQDAQTEHVLGRQSLGVCRLNHLLRVHGHHLHKQGKDLQRFDDATFSAMSRLFPGITPEGRVQASLAAAKGGLGWRSATDSALAANLAALIAATPKVHSLAQDAAKAGLLPLGILEAAFRQRLDHVRKDFFASLDESERPRATRFLTAATKATEDQWLAACMGKGWAFTKAPRAEASFTGLEELATDPGEEAMEASPEGRQVTPGNLQRELCRLVDCTKLRHLEDTLTAQCNWPQLARLRELRHPDVSHTWLWHLDHTSGSVLSEEDYVLNVQKRLGAQLVDCSDTVPQCRVCQKHLDPQLEHCETCCIADATRGHYACVRAVVAGLRAADPSVTTEPQGLTDSQARPADILTTAAVPGRRAALDLCVASPNAAGAGGDAAEAAFKRKLRHYAHVVPQLHQAGIAFRPLIWTADGRPHPAASRTLRYAAERAAYKGGRVVTPSEYYRRWSHEISIAILRRRAAMARAGMPKQHGLTEWLQSAERDEHGQRAANMEEDPTLPFRRHFQWEPDNLFCAALGGA